MDLGEHLGLAVGALGLEEGLAAFHRLARLLEDADHVETAAAAQAEQEHLHRPHTQIAPATLGWTVHHYHMAAARLAKEHGLAGPLDACFHQPDSVLKKSATV
ncbi:hypothetical protein D9M71_502660 [compost metagenome]